MTENILMCRDFRVQLFQKEVSGTFLEKFQKSKSSGVSGEVSEKK